jgi:hypothetical protein
MDSNYSDVIKVIKKYLDSVNCTKFGNLIIVEEIRPVLGNTCDDHGIQLCSIDFRHENIIKIIADTIEWCLLWFPDHYVDHEEWLFNANIDHKDYVNPNVREKIVKFIDEINNEKFNSLFMSCSCGDISVLENRFANSLKL